VRAGGHLIHDVVPSIIPYRARDNRNEGP